MEILPSTRIHFPDQEDLEKEIRGGKEAKNCLRKPEGYGSIIYGLCAGGVEVGNFENRDHNFICNRLYCSFSSCINAGRKISRAGALPVWRIPTGDRTEDVPLRELS